MSKLRLVFKKEDQASYISHLDLMRTFHRVFLRADLTIRHSNGFHPHPIMSIVMPLPVGQSSDCELLDVEVNEETSGHDVPRRINDSLPAGLRILDCYEQEGPVRDLALLKAKVELDYDGGVPQGAAAAIAALFERESLIIQKKTKRKELADIDIKPLICSLEIQEEEEKLILLVTVRAQNPGLNPALLEQAIRRELPDFAPDFVRVRRLAFLKENGEVFR